MSNININWEEIGISNDFLFGKVMRNAELCKELTRSFVIFICPSDVFGKGRHIYTFENTCKEDQTLLLGDGTTKIFLNANSEMNDVSGELKAFLDYVVGKKSDDSFVKKLEKAVEEAKKNREWRHEYMTLLMRDQENREEGIEQGEDRLSELIKRLVEDNRSSDIIKVTQDKEYRRKQYKEYDIL